MASKVSLESLVVQAEFVRLPMGLVVDRIDLRIGSATATTKPMELQLAEPGSLDAFISQEAVAAYLEDLGPGGLSQFKVECGEGQIVVHAKARILLEVPVKAICQLHIVNGKQLRVVLVDAEVVGGDAKRLVSGQIDRVNPIFDAAELPFDVTLSDVEVRDGGITLHGTAQMAQSS